uniref:TIR domain containing adaptor protein n=1 Tax=Monodelphis domestica TaxID=13616 RepID=A0A5F8H688_MONDO
MIPDPDQGFPCPISVLPPLDQLRAQVKRHQPPHLHFPAPKAGDFNRMAGWFRQILRKPKKRHMQSESSTRDVSELPSQSSSLPPRQDSASAPTPKPADTDSRSSGSRWSKTYDVCVCHSEEDLIPAQELVSYLEDEPDGLRCFMHLRDAAPGGAIVSELCQALGSSHCCVLFITPHFLQDPWCKYQMLQALSEAPGSEGHTIPLVTGLARSNYPPELRFMYYVDGNGPDNGFPKICKNLAEMYTPSHHRGAQDVGARLELELEGTLRVSKKMWWRTRQVLSGFVVSRHFYSASEIAHSWLLQYLVFPFLSTQICPWENSGSEEFQIAAMPLS